MSEEKKPTGYPSIDKPWLKYYKPGAEERALDIPAGKTVWDVIEEKLLQYKNIPAIEYFGRVISRPRFIDMVYTWARAFKALGVKEDEVIPYYGPFFPDVGAMAFALNILGACPYFLKLAISPAALDEETRESRFAIVFGDMWANVGGEFSKERFEKVIVITVPDGMRTPLREFVALHSKLHDKEKPQLPSGGKYLRLEAAKRYARHFKGEVRVPFVPDRPAFITSSSGTTVGGIVKGVVATNESAIAQIISTSSSEIKYPVGQKTLNHFPPTATTSLNSLFLLPLANGETILFDPRVSVEDFYNQIVKSKPNICVNTGCVWEAFFNRISDEMKQGKTFDFSYSTSWVIGGEGNSVKKIKKWNEIMHDCGAPSLWSGYGLSETFSGISFDNENAECDFSKPIPGVGIPQAGMTVGVFDAVGNELPYNQRGELRVKTKAAMKGYYKKPELTTETLIDGWVHTGDLAEIDENGFIYIWGRLKDTITLPNGQEVFWFDVTNKVLGGNFIDDAVVLPIPTEDGGFNLVAHIVWSKPLTEKEKAECLTALNKAVKEAFPEGIRIAAWAEHDGMLPYSPTTLKKDKNKLSKQTEGYVQVVDGALEAIEFEPVGDGSAYRITRKNTNEGGYYGKGKRT